MAFKRPRAEISADELEKHLKPVVDAGGRNWLCYLEEPKNDATLIGKNHAFLLRPHDLSPNLRFRPTTVKDCLKSIFGKNCEDWTIPDRHKPGWVNLMSLRWDCLVHAVGAGMSKARSDGIPCPSMAKLDFADELS